MKKILAWFKSTFGDTWLSKLIEKAVASLDNSNKGLSGKKLTIIALVYCIINMHEYWCSYAYAKNDFSLFPVVLGSDIGAVLALFGINEYGKKKVNKIEVEQTDSVIQTDDSTTVQSESTTTQTTG